MTTPQQLLPSQSEPEVPLNENSAALGQAWVWAHDVTADTGLTVGLAGGNFAATTVAADILACADDDTNYIVVDRGSLTLSVDTATTDWDDTANFGRIARAVFAAGVLTWYDERYSPGGIFDNSATVSFDLSDAIHSAASKATPVDADEIPLADSAASFAVKKLNWANLKATAKSYFDTLYAAIGAITGSGLTMATGKLLGRSTASTGAIEEITIGSGLSLAGGTLTSTGTGGTVTVTGSPASGNLTKFSGASSITNADLTGDVTTSGGVAATIQNNTVTYAKMQDVSATSRVLGRKTAGSGDVEECTVAEVLEFIGSLAHGDILYRNATQITRLAAGTAGQKLQTNGSGADPSWANSGVDGGSSTVDLQTFSADGTWTKPSGAKVVRVIAYGGGGGGAGGEGGNAASTARGAAAGGGGARVEMIFNAADLASTVAITIGAAGNAGAGSVGGVGGTSGGAGGNTTFGAYLTAYGGGGGGFGANAARSGGSGGGSCGAGGVGGSGTTTGGLPATTANNAGYSGGGGGSGTASANPAEHGGGGGAQNGTGAGAAGAPSMFGSGGGGAGGGVAAATPSAGGAGGGTRAYANNGGGGGAGGSGAVGTAGSAATVGIGATGGGGGGGINGAGSTGYAGGAGGVGGGGGGGGGGAAGSGSCTGGAGGAGGAGKVFVITW